MCICVCVSVSVSLIFIVIFCGTLEFYSVEQEGHSLLMFISIAKDVISA